MSYTHVLKILTLSAFRKGLTTLTLLVILPPILVSLTLTSSISVIRSQSENLLRYGGGAALVLNNYEVKDDCVRVRYGVLSLTYGNASRQLPVINVVSIDELSRVLGVKLTQLNTTCVGYTASLSTPQLRGLNITLNQVLNACSGGECFNMCLAYSHSRHFEEVLIIEGALTHLSEGFLCIVNSSKVSRSIIDCLLRDLTGLSSLYVLLIMTVYVPILYLFNVKIVHGMGQELRVLRAQGLSILESSLAFTSATCLEVGVLSLYCTALSYLILYTGGAVLGFLSGAVVPGPQPSLNDLTPALIMTLVEIPVGYAAFRVGGFDVVSKS